MRTRDIRIRFAGLGAVCAALSVAMGVGAQRPTTKPPDLAAIRIAQPRRSTVVQRVLRGKARHPLS